MYYALGKYSGVEIRKGKVVNGWIVKRRDACGDRKQIKAVIDLSDKFILKEVNDFRGRPVFIVIDPETKEVLDDANERDMQLVQKRMRRISNSRRSWKHVLMMCESIRGW